MSASASPARLSAAFDDDLAFTADINARMRVPKRIQVTGEGDDRFQQHAGLPNGAGAAQMSVPDRIVVLGDDWGARVQAPPRPAVAGYLSAGEELELLRRQLLKVNRRLMQIEVENQRRRSREVMLYTAGVAYFVMKVVLWMGRSL
ncbi:transport and Golgi organization protein 11-like [Pollicipes pollicipes]|uniref:transport and Golgi organization protein 11-like n=1 Tax=Pollicipes pollicipes TaxID=41117 RepID=UPI00188519A9|nr:transport and Golgi organization protein 11-like [Pollicipes pollicipes]